MGNFVLGYNKENSEKYLKIPALDLIIKKYNSFEQKSRVMSKVLVEIYLSACINSHYSYELYSNFFKVNEKDKKNNGLFVVKTLLNNDFSKIDLNPSVINQIKSFHSKEEEEILDYYSKKIYEETKNKTYFRRPDNGEKYEIAEMFSSDDFKRVLDIGTRTINNSMIPTLDLDVIPYISKKLFPDYGIMNEEKYEIYIKETNRDIKKKMNFAFFSESKNIHCEENEKKVISNAWPIWKSGKLWTNTRKKNEKKYSLLTEVISSSDIKAIFGNIVPSNITSMYIVDVLKKEKTDFGLCDSEEKAEQMTHAISRKIINDLEVKIYLTGRVAKRNFELFQQNYDKQNKIKLLNLYENIKKFNSLPNIVKKYILAKTDKNKVHLYKRIQRS